RHAGVSPIFFYDFFFQVHIQDTFFTVDFCYLGFKTDLPGLHFGDMTLYRAMGLSTMPILTFTHLFLLHVK
ncbi:MAG: hypothetical protein K2N96_06555, partial [Muribaculaceae bacterium]|nr:hypothetical protein [Muribaculaceae bacterium]